MIIELHPSGVESKPPADPEPDRWTSRHAVFAARSEPVAQLVLSCGGQVVERAWINSTMKALVPAPRLSEIAENDRVKLIDLPASL